MKSKKQSSASGQNYSSANFEAKKFWEKETSKQCSTSHTSACKRKKSGN